jgi:limonene-1,2-epoxide hydrolase
MANTQAEDLLTRFVAGWERADVDELLGYFTEDPVWHPMPMDPVVGKAALRDALSTWLGGTSQLGVDIIRQLSDRNTVMHERNDRFSFGGQEQVLPVCAVFEIEDGRIAVWREYFDMSPFTGPSGDEPPLSE